MIALLGILGGLILLQPDLSAAATVIIIGGILFFLAGADWRQIVIAIASSALIGTIGLKLYSTGASRLNDYLAGSERYYRIFFPRDARYGGGH